MIGAALDAWMLIPDWERGVTTPEASGVALSHVVDHIDHVCQLAGNADHAGFGTDLDGGFGREQAGGGFGALCRSTEAFWPCSLRAAIRGGHKKNL
ncbi:MAG: hypothetical protein Ct9H300mP32_3550 [Verrucomicrobiota bacterium]|nr:MAG: hypothetical protein Ct9H300mP32_3550 [Verrucomicrobiota bacterium]